jgi:acyl-CoA synthetase (AMP-forming)/AMP-acid ligase II
MELGLLLDMAAGADPDRIALTDVDGTSMTRAELDAAASCAAARFGALGATRVGYLGTNGRALPVALFGAARAGVPFVPFNYRLADDQLAPIMSAEPGLVLIAGPDFAERARTLGAASVLTTTELLAADGDAPVDAAVDPEAIAVLLYTSGTTAAPKAAILRHRHFVSYVLGTVEFASADDDEAVLVSVPPYHVAGVSTILTNLYSGRRVVYLDPFDPARGLELVRTEGVTHAMVVPTMLARIVDELGDADANVPTLRALAYGGARMPAPVIERALVKFPGVDFTNAYGLTETSSTITVLGPDDHRDAIASADPAVRARLGSAGRPVPGVELIVLDQQGEPCPPDVLGDVLVRGEQVSGEYVGGSAVEGEGWFPTRDRGWIDAEGYLFIEGRADDTIIRGGENIAPAEIEDVLMRHPSVKECAVVGVADDEWGQRIAAAVVLVRDDAPIESEELRDWVREQLRSSKTPDVIEIRTMLPYTDSGKLLRREVRASFTTAPTT